MNVKWRDSRYNTSSADLGCGLNLTVSWSTKRLPPGEPHYDVYVFGQPTNVRCETMDEGKRVAEDIARGRINSMLKKLDWGVDAEAAE
jgi:hypothetical protein